MIYFEVTKHFMNPWLKQTVLDRVNDFCYAPGIVFLEIRLLCPVWNLGTLEDIRIWREGKGTLGKVVIQELLKEKILLKFLPKSVCESPFFSPSPLYNGPVWNVRTVSAQAKSLNVTAFLEYGDERLASFRGLEIRVVGKYLRLVGPRSLVSIISD